MLKSQITINSQSETDLQTTAQNPTSSKPSELPRLSSMSLTEDTEPRFQLIHGKRRFIRVDVEKANRALRHAIKKHADFFEA
jgi:hypothetical protein